MANTDYTVTLAVEGKEFSSTIKKANKEMQEMKRSAHGAGSSFGEMSRMFGKFVGLLGGAQAAMSAFHKLTTDNQAVADEWARTMEAASAAYSGFMGAIVSGDFSNYFSNMKQLVSLAREAADAMDRLASAQIVGGVGMSELDKQIEMYKAMSKSSNPAEQMKASKALPGLIAQRNQVVNQQIVEQRNAGDALMKSALAKKGFFGDFSQYSDYYNTWEGYNKAEEIYAKVRERNRAQQQVNSYNNSPGMPEAEREKARVRLAEAEKALEPIPKALQLFASALSEISDEELQAILSHYIEANKMQQMQYQVQGAANRAINKGKKAAEAATAGDQVKIKANTSSILDKFDFDVDKISEDILYQLAPIINRMQEAMAAQITQRGVETSYINQIANPETTKQVYNYSDALGAVSQAISGVSSATSGMNSGLSMALGIIQSILSVVGGILSIVGGASPLGMFGLMGGLIGGKFAKGGVVGGTSYAGDHLVASVSSGEMVLTRAQQSNLLALANGQARGGASEAYVRGDTIYMSLSNYMSRTGKKLQ